MKVLHTSDWHLGKHLEGFSRLEEQKFFLEELCAICIEREIDMVIIAGDVFDTSNPPAQAEKLYYEYIKKLSDNGRRPVIAIAGNHDSPDRIQAAWPLAREQAILLAGNPKIEGYSGPFGQHTIKWLGSNVYEILIDGSAVRVGLLPYPSERRLGEIMGDTDDETLKQASYTERLRHIFSEMDEKFDASMLNIAVSHIFVMGGQTSESERPIQIGGTLVVDPQDLAHKADYIALGHLHRPQQVKHAPVPTIYSGAPLQYSRSELAYSKSVHVIEKAEGVLDMEEVMLSLRKPIEVWRCDGVQEAFEKCEKNRDRNVWVYLEVKTNAIIAQSDIKALKELRPDLLSIMPIIDNQKETHVDEKPEEKSFEHLFGEYYEQVRGVKPGEDVLKLLGSILNEEVEDEADKADHSWVEQLYRETDN